MARSRDVRTVARWLAIALLLALPAATSAQDSNESESESESADSTSKSADSSTTASSESDSGGQLKRGDEMQFDARLVRGERASGAVFLFERTRRKLPSMVEKRRSYLEESVRSLLGPTWSATFRERRSSDRDRGDGEGAEAVAADGEGDIIDQLAAERDAED